MTPVIATTHQVGFVAQPGSLGTLPVAGTTPGGTPARRRTPRHHRAAPVVHRVRRACCVQVGIEAELACTADGAIHRTPHGKETNAVPVASAPRAGYTWDERRTPSPGHRLHSGNSPCTRHSSHGLMQNRRLYRGALPRTPALPRRWGMQMGSSPRPSRQSPTPEPPGRQGLTSIGPWADPCRPGEPGVAHRVPGRGDDLTPSQCRARICARDGSGSSGTPETQVSSQGREQDNRPGQAACQRTGGTPETVIVRLITQR